MASRIGGTPTLNSVQKSGINVYSLDDTSTYTFFNLTSPTSGNSKIRLLASSSASSVGQILMGSNDSSSVGVNILGSGKMKLGGVSIVASAIMQLDSTSSGFLPPRMTTAQKNAISSPATGLMVYDTDLAALCFFNGLSWKQIQVA